MMRTWNVLPTTWLLASNKIHSVFSKIVRNYTKVEYASMERLPTQGLQKSRAQWLLDSFIACVLHDPFPVVAARRVWTQWKHPTGLRRANEVTHAPRKKV
jgi:hypothetical protein